MRVYVGLVQQSIDEKALPLPFHTVAYFEFAYFLPFALALSSLILHQIQMRALGASSSSLVLASVPFIPSSALKATNEISIFAMIHLFD